MLIRSSKYVQIFIYLFVSNNTDTVGKIASITLKTSEIAEKNYRELFVVKIIEKVPRMIKLQVVWLNGIIYRIIYTIVTPIMVS